jgi:predicted AAA+ superfamily ATPase
MLLRFYRERGELCDHIAYWAPAETLRTEVDFVLRRGRELVAVEIKTSKALRPADVVGLRAIAELKGLKRRVLVFQGPRPLVTRDGIDVLPFTDFTRELAEGSLFP